MDAVRSTTHGIMGKILSFFFFLFLKVSNQIFLDQIFQHHLVLVESQRGLVFPGRFVSRFLLKESLDQ